MEIEKLQKKAIRASKLLKAMGNPNRLMILCQLAQGEKCVGDLEEIIGLSQSAMSQHLAKLRRDHFVKTRRSAQTIFYSLAGEEAKAVIGTLYGLYCVPERGAREVGGPRIAAASRGNGAGRAARR